MGVIIIILIGLLLCIFILALALLISESMTNIGKKMMKKSFQKELKYKEEGSLENIVLHEINAETRKPLEISKLGLYYLDKGKTYPVILHYSISPPSYVSIYKTDREATIMLTGSNIKNLTSFIRDRELKLYKTSYFFRTFYVLKEVDQDPKVQFLF